MGIRISGDREEVLGFLGTIDIAERDIIGGVTLQDITVQMGERTYHVVGYEYGWPGGLTIELADFDFEDPAAVIYRVTSTRKKARS